MCLNICNDFLYVSLIMFWKYLFSTNLVCYKIITVMIIILSICIFSKFLQVLDFRKLLLVQATAVPLIGGLLVSIRACVFTYEYACAYIHAWAPKRVTSVSHCKLSCWRLSGNQFLKFHSFENCFGIQKCSI